MELSEVVFLPRGNSCVEFLVYLCDAAMLTVDDNEFWQGVSPVEFGDLPALQDAVTVVGYPIGGDTISVTSGVVSRMEILSYVHGSTELLGLQVVRLWFGARPFVGSMPVAIQIRPNTSFLGFSADRCCYKFGEFGWTCF